MPERPTSGPYGDLQHEKLDTEYATAPAKEEKKFHRRPPKAIRDDPAKHQQQPTFWRPVGGPVPPAMFSMFYPTNLPPIKTSQYRNKPDMSSKALNKQTNKHRHVNCMTHEEFDHIPKINSESSVLRHSKTCHRHPKATCRHSETDASSSSGKSLQKSRLRSGRSKERPADANRNNATECSREMAGLTANNDDDDDAQFQTQWKTPTVHTGTCCPCWKNVEMPKPPIDNECQTQQCVKIQELSLELDSTHPPADMPDQETCCSMNKTSLEQQANEAEDRPNSAQEGDDFLELRGISLVSLHSEPDLLIEGSGLLNESTTSFALSESTDHPHEDVQDEAEETSIRCTSVAMKMMTEHLLSKQREIRDLDSQIVCDDDGKDYKEDSVLPQMPNDDTPQLQDNNEDSVSCQQVDEENLDSQIVYDDNDDGIKSPSDMSLHQEHEDSTQLQDNNDEDSVSPDMPHDDSCQKIGDEDLTDAVTITAEDSHDDEQSPKPTENTSDEADPPETDTETQTQGEETTTTESLNVNVHATQQMLNQDYRDGSNLLAESDAVADGRISNMSENCLGDEFAVTPKTKEHPTQGDDSFNESVTFYESTAVTPPAETRHGDDSVNESVQLHESTEDDKFLPHDSQSPETGNIAQDSVEFDDHVSVVTQETVNEVVQMETSLSKHPEEVTEDDTCLHMAQSSEIDDETTRSLDGGVTNQISSEIEEPGPLEDCKADPLEVARVLDEVKDAQSARTTRSFDGEVTNQISTEIEEPGPSVDYKADPEEIGHVLDEVLSAHSLVSKCDKDVDVTTGLETIKVDIDKKAPNLDDTEGEIMGTDDVKDLAADESALDMETECDKTEEEEMPSAVVKGGGPCVAEADTEDTNREVEEKMLLLRSPDLENSIKRDTTVSKVVSSTDVLPVTEGNDDTREPTEPTLPTSPESEDKPPSPTPPDQQHIPTSADDQTDKGKPLSPTPCDNQHDVSTPPADDQTVKASDRQSCNDSDANSSDVSGKPSAKKSRHKSNRRPKTCKAVTTSGENAADQDVTEKGAIGPPRKSKWHRVRSAPLHVDQDTINTRCHEDQPPQVTAEGTRNQEDAGAFFEIPEMPVTGDTVFDQCFMGINIINHFSNLIARHTHQSQRVVVETLQSLKTDDETYKRLLNCREAQICSQAMQNFLDDFTDLLRQFPKLTKVEKQFCQYVRALAIEEEEMRSKTTESETLVTRQVKWLEENSGTDRRKGNRVTWLDEKEGSMDQTQETRESAKSHGMASPYDRQRNEFTSPCDPQLSNEAASPDPDDSIRSRENTSPYGSHESCEVKSPDEGSQVYRSPDVLTPDGNHRQREELASADEEQQSREVDLPDVSQQLYSMISPYGFQPRQQPDEMTSPDDQQRHQDMSSPDDLRGPLEKASLDNQRQSEISATPDSPLSATP